MGRKKREEAEIYLKVLTSHSPRWIEEDHRKPRWEFLVPGRNLYR